MRMCHRAMVFAPPPLPPPAAAAHELQSAGDSSGQADAGVTESRPAEDAGASAADMLAHGIAALGLVSDTGSSSAPNGSSCPPAASTAVAGTPGTSASGETSAPDDGSMAAAPINSSTTAPDAEAAGNTAGSAAAVQAPQHPEALLWAWLTPMLLRLGLPVSTAQTMATELQGWAALHLGSQLLLDLELQPSTLT
jgi:hypothetical protein